MDNALSLYYSKLELPNCKAQELEKNQDIIDLVYRIKRNDLLAMKVVYNQYVKDMLTLSYRITGNMHDSEEVIQNAFLNSFEKISQLKEPQKYGSWLKRSVINKSLSAIKGHHRFDEISEELIEELPQQRDENNWFGEISLEKIKLAITKLPDGCRQVLTLFLFEDYRHKEIANLLGIAESTSKSQYRYALKLLKTDLTKYYV